MKNEPELHDGAPMSDVLRLLTATEFDRGLHEARRRRDEAAAVLAEYERWFERLEPYFRRDPTLTVDRAVALYRADHTMTQR